MREVPRVIVIGGANLDVKARTSAPLVVGTSNPGSTLLTPGGVGRNVAENLARLGTPVRLVSAVGDDPLGDLVVRSTAEAGVDVTGIRRLAGATATYTAVLDAGGELVAGIADMSAADAITPDAVEASAIGEAALLVLDGNLPVESVAHALDLAAAAGVPVVLDPVSVPKAGRLAGVLNGRRLFMVTPTLEELGALGSPDTEILWVRLGASGSVLRTAAGETEVAAVAAEVVDVTGAGDAMLAAFVHAHLGGASPADAAAYGHAAAALTVASPHTVRPDLTDELVRSLL